MSSLNSIKWDAEIVIDAPTDELKLEVATVVDFPENKTPDLLFFHGVMLSTGTNMNNAHFLGSEIVKADDTIDLKALDIEHEEQAVIGHIFSHKIVSYDGVVMDKDKLREKTDAELDSMNFDVHIAGIIYKSRFSELAKEIKDGKWRLSMETYYQDYDIKVGQVIMSKKEAESLGLAAENVLGKVARLTKAGVEVAKGEVARVLRGLMFSGCGVVKNPAEPRATILETAKQKEFVVEGVDVEIEGLEEVVTDNKAVVSDGDKDIIEKDKKDKEVSDLDSLDNRQQTSVGLCVSYRKFVYDHEPPGPDSVLQHENWCVLYDAACTSPSRGADHEKCLRNQIKSKTLAYVNSCIKNKTRGMLLCNLQDLLRQVNNK